MRIAQAVPCGARLCDTIAVIAPKEAAILRANGVDGVFRYLETLTSEEVDGLHAAKLGVVPLAYAKNYDGAWQVQRAKAIGIPIGVSLPTDFEADPRDAKTVSAELDACGRSKVLGGYRSVLYNGAGHILTGADLFSLPNVHGYWESMSDVPRPKCGYMCQQMFPGNRAIEGLPFRVDFNMARNDWEGRSLFWCVAQ